jgi:hypothetical protein
LQGLRPARSEVGVRNARSDKKNGQLCAIAFLVKLSLTRTRFGSIISTRKPFNALNTMEQKNRLISQNHSFCEPPSANLKRWLDSHDFAATPEA